MAERTPEEEKALIDDLLKHPGARLLARRVRKSVTGMLRAYDEAVLNGDWDKAQKVAYTRWFFNTQLPQMLDEIKNEGLPPRSWTWRFKEWLAKR